MHMFTIYTDSAASNQMVKDTVKKAFTQLSYNPLIIMLFNLSSGRVGSYNFWANYMSVKYTLNAIIIINRIFNFIS